eukprot:TRINITY_DN14423_c0_g1_i1.p1 TRINITY_DN14423_c0_g1~~TRINITY_DN14423_c0_g1_i1.p1  ORF type:complete len:307 (+),score=42.66 TRINITY_DN14423_c0_g1_i1:161-1081(+)
MAQRAFFSPIRVSTSPPRRLRTGSPDGPLPVSPTSLESAKLPGTPSSRSPSGSTTTSPSYGLFGAAISSRLSAPPTAATSIQALYRGYRARKGLQDRVLQTGYLYMQRSNMDDQWTQFWFVLKYFTMSYFENVKDTSPVGVIHLESIRIHDTVFDDSTGTPQECGFMLQYDEEQVYFWSSTPAERTDWLHSLKTACIVKTGFLRKRTTAHGEAPRVSAWKKRWCVLSRRTLVMYRHVNDTERTDVVYLRGCTVTAAPTADTPYQHALVVVSSDVDMYLAAETFQEKMEWVNVLLQMLQNLPAQTRP